MIIDFRSDTVTKPTPGMMDAMMKASVGDDVFREDPTVNLLEKNLANLFNMEAALFCASGTMSNQIAITSHSRPGDELICEQEAHVYIYEGGGIAFNAGCQTRPIIGDRGRIKAEQVLKNINADDVHKARTSIVCLENTSNRGGGSCYDLEEIRKIRAVCDKYKLILHLDGARLFNALIAKKEKPGDYGSLFHSISVCFNKGLGCPAGSVLLGSGKFIHQARRVRKVFGGGMRQAGFLAATALYALDQNVERLSIDHKHAKKIGEALQKHPLVKMVLPVETNLVIFELNDGEDPHSFISRMKEKEVLLLTISNNRLRIVTHLDISEEMVSDFLKTLAQFE
ncbi:MAG TPA: GntG family PLP-dependent aldolase [Puia sp.]|jgi:threonine aldolase|nr:GntG family PLP-dependent aldolase [Puia sp.]